MNGTRTSKPLEKWSLHIVMGHDVLPFFLLHSQIQCFKAQGHPTASRRQQLYSLQTEPLPPFSSGNGIINTAFAHFFLFAFRYLHFPSVVIFPLPARLPRERGGEERFPSPIPILLHFSLPLSRPLADDLSLSYRQEVASAFVVVVDVVL